MENRVTAGTIARTIILLFALLNQILTALGKPIIAVNSETITELVACVFTIVTAIVAWWKNNSFTKAAIAGDKLMNCIRSGQSYSVTYTAGEDNASDTTEEL